MANVAHLKSFRLNEQKDPGTNKIPEDLVSKWQNIIEANIKKNPDWLLFIIGDKATWAQKKETNRGFENSEDGKKHATIAEAVLMYIAQYAHGVLFTRILTLSTSMKHAFQIVRTWAGLATVGSSWKTYLDIRDSYKEHETSVNDFYYELYEASLWSTVRT